MKFATTLVTLATIAIASTNAAQGSPYLQSTRISLTQDFDPMTMSQGQIIKFFENVSKTYWKSTVRGWYSSTGRTLELDEINCFGEWLSADLHKIDDAVAPLLSLDFAHLSFEQLFGIKEAVAELVEKNMRFCGMDVFAEEVQSFWKENVDLDAVLDNVQKEAFSTMQKLMPLIDLMNTLPSLRSYADIYKAVDTIGYTVAAVASSFIGFQ